MKKLVTFLLFLSLSIPAFAKSPEMIELTGRNTIILNTVIDDTTADTFSAAVVGKRVMLGDETTPLYVIIVSGGGQYGASLKFKKLFEVIPGISLICKYCASAAGMLFVTHKGPRLAIKKTVVLMHEMYLQHATIKDVMNNAEMRMFYQQNEDFNKMHYSIIGISRDEYEKKIVGKEWIVEGEETVKLHLADKVVKIHCDAYISMLAPDTCKEKED